MTTYARTRDPQLRERLIEANLPMVRRIVGGMAAKANLPPHLDRDDLVSLGTIGLVKAIDGFSERGGAGFTTYAHHHIRGAVQHAIRDALPGVRSAREANVKIYAATLRLERELGREPSPAEVMAEAGMSQAEYDRGTSAELVLPASLDVETLGEDSKTPTTALDYLADPRPGLADTDELDVTAAVDRLPEPMRSAVILRYWDDLTQVTIAERYGVSQIQVSRWLADAGARLRVILGPGFGPQ